MQNFVIKNLVTENIEAELEKIGFDKTYIHKASDKYRYKTLKIFNLSLPQANIFRDVRANEKWYTVRKRKTSHMGLC